MTDTPTHFRVPGLVPTGPRLITSRFDVADGHTFIMPVMQPDVNPLFGETIGYILIGTAGFSVTGDRPDW
jgi:hypothetical protein